MKLLAPPAPNQPKEARRPTFSIVVAVYQAAATVAQAVQSALAQTQPPLEVIVYDDGSTDGLEEALRPYRDEITPIRASHRGVGTAKKAACEAASGDFIALLDSDDVYLPHRLELIACAAAGRPDLSIITTNAFLEAGGRLIRQYYDPSFEFAVHDQRSEILKRNFVLGNAAVRRSDLEAVGGFDATLRSAEDWDCWIRLILAGASAGLVDEPLARYRLQPTGLSSQRAHHLRERVRVLEKATRNPDLLDHERPAALDSLHVQRRQLQLAEAYAAVRDGSGDARRKAYVVARDNGYPFAARLRAVACVVAPAIARRRLLALERGSWTTSGGLRVPR